MRTIRQSYKTVTLLTLLGLATITIFWILLLPLSASPVDNNPNSLRIAYLKQLQGRLEIYFQKNGEYPAGSFLQMRKVVDNASTSNNSFNDLYNDFQYATDSVKQAFILGVKLKKPIEPSLENRLSHDIDGIVYGIDCNEPVYCISAFYEE